MTNTGHWNNAINLKQQEITELILPGSALTMFTGKPGGKTIIKHSFVIKKEHWEFMVVERNAIPNQMCGLVYGGMDAFLLMVLMMVAGQKDHLWDK